MKTCNFQFLHVIILLILIVLSSCCIYSYKYKQNLENYDGRISDITKENCGDFCTKTLGCGGFGYNNLSKKCYISKAPIIGSPINSAIFAKEYVKGDLLCNKLYPIVTDPEIYNDEMLKNNAVYSCYQNLNNIPTSYSIIDGNIMEIKKDSDVTNLKIKKYVPEYIEWFSEKRDIDKKIIDDLYNKNEKKINYTNHKKYYDGDYLFLHECVSQISKNDCLNACGIEDKCVGVEWNPLFSNEGHTHENVCCLKKTIGEKQNRNKKYEYGRFYKKISL
jgi:hypothetical protein